MPPPGATPEQKTVGAADFPTGRWRARWIWSRPAPIALRGNSQPVIDHDRARGYVLFRRSFVLDTVARRVVARVTADSRYILWVNGTEIGRGPVRGQPQRLHYDQYDLAPQLREGANTIAILARHYGHPTPWWMPVTPTFGLGGGALLFEAALGEPLDPSTVWITSDGTWSTCEPDAWDELTGEGIGDMAAEACDGGALPAHWQVFDDESKPGLGASDDVAWKPATVLATNHVGYPGDPHPPTHPYGPLLARPIPHLTGAVRRGAMVATATVPDRALGDTDALAADPVAQYSLDEAGVETFISVPSAPDHLILPVANATVQIVLVDFGEQVAGHLAICLSAAKGTRIDAKASEARGENGSLESLQQHSGFRYVARGPGGDESATRNTTDTDETSETFETFDTIGLRYLGLAIRATGAVNIESVSVTERLFPRATSTARPATPGQAVPSFACSDPVLDDIWRIGRRTVDLCSQDAYLDCPSREQRAWTGDSVVHQMVDLTTNLDWSLARWNVELGGAPRADGMLPMAAGGDFEFVDNTFIPDWSLHWVHALHNLYQYTGDAELISTLLPIAERVVRWFVPFQDRDGLLDNVTGWTIIDWAAVSANGKSAALNGLWARALRGFAAMSRWLGDDGRARWADATHDRVSDGFELFWDAERARYVDSIVDDVAGRVSSQHGNAAAIVGGVVPSDRLTALANLMIDPSIQEHAAWLVPERVATLEGNGDMYSGFGYLVMGPPEPWWDVETRLVTAQPFYRYVVHDAVALAGLSDRIPDLCRDWTVVMSRSATTWSEVWYGGSHCHAWSSTPTRDLVQRTLGIVPAEPGFTRALVAPCLGDLEWCKGSAPTPFGLIHVDVDAIRVLVDTPVPATVIIDAAERSIPAGFHTITRGAATP